MQFVKIEIELCERLLLKRQKVIDNISNLVLCFTSTFLQRKRR